MALSRANEDDRLSQSDGPAAVSIDPEKPTSRTKLILSILLLINIFAFVDRQLPFILAESIKKDLSLSDTQTCVIGGLPFALFYGLSILPLAAIADRWSAKWTLTICLTIWSLTTTLGGLATSFWQLAATRAGVALGEAASSPSAHVLIAETWAPKKRAFAIGIYSMGVLIGIMTGLALGGWLNDFADWRLAMILIGLPGVVLAIVFALLTPDRRRAVQDRQQIKTRAAAKLLLATPSYVYIAAALATFGIGAYAMLAFSPAFLVRVQGFSTTQAGIALGLLNGVGGIGGSILGGYFTERVRARDPRYVLMLPAAGFADAAPTMIAAWLAQSGVASVALLFIPAISITLYLAPCFAMAQALAPPGARATASALLPLGPSLLGASVGPVAVGAISDALASTHGVNSLQYALCATTLAFPIAAALLFRGAAHLKRDLEATL